MNNSLKIGIVAGLIAGIVAGLISVFIIFPLINQVGSHWFGFPLSEFPFMKVALTDIMNDIVWGIIFGIIYFKTYRVIPGKGISKGLVYGLFIILVLGIRFITHDLIYWNPQHIISYIIYYPISCIPFGLVLGFLYEYLHNRYSVPKKEPKIIEYSMMSGFYPGAIAGFMGGIASFIAQTTITVGVEKIYWSNVVMDISFLISKLGGQIMWHMMWGAILGLIFPKVYNLVPGKGIIKGLIYSLIVQFLIFELLAVTYTMFLGYFIMAHTIFFSGISQSIIYGLVLGLLYRKPTK